jgi:hypothetical protein
MVLRDQLVVQVLQESLVLQDQVDLKEMLERLVRMDSQGLLDPPVSRVPLVLRGHQVHPGPQGTQEVLVILVLAEHLGRQELWALPDLRVLVEVLDPEEMPVNLAYLEIPDKLGGLALQDLLGQVVVREIKDHQDLRDQGVTLDQLDQEVNQDPLVPQDLQGTWAVPDNLGPQETLGLKEPADLQVMSVQ